MGRHGTRVRAVFLASALVGLLGSPGFWVGQVAAQSTGLKKGATKPAAANAESKAKPDRPPEQGLFIFAARIGTQERWLDITKTVQEHVKDGKLVGLPASLPDPARGKAQAVVIAYAMDGKVGLSVTRDGEPVSLPPTHPDSAGLVAVPNAPLAVLAGRLGDGGEWKDVTEPLQKRIVKDRLELEFPAASLLPGFLPDTRQALAVLYSRRGRVRLWLRRDDPEKPHFDTEHFNHLV